MPESKPQHRGRNYVPVFQVVFEYNPEDGDLAIHAKGKIAQKSIVLDCQRIWGGQQGSAGERKSLQIGTLSSDCHQKNTPCHLTGDKRGKNWGTRIRT